MNPVPRLRSVLHRLRRHLHPPPLVLLYHRVHDPVIDSYDIAVTPDRFAEHMEILRDRFHPISLQRLVSDLRNGKAAARGVVVTFDDGYIDNVRNALPILERFEIPATIYIPPSYVGGPREFWWDEIERALLMPGRLPEKISLEIGGARREWNLGNEAILDENTFERSRHWKLLQPPTLPARQQMLRDLYDPIRELTTGQQRTVLDQIHDSGQTTAPSMELNRCVTEEELRQLDRHELIEIGVHTMTHCDLTATARETQRTEINDSKKLLEEMLGRTMRTFSYPYGLYTPETVEIVRESGFESAVTCAWSPIFRKADPLQLPRHTVQNLTGGEFIQTLDHWLNA